MQGERRASHCGLHRGLSLGLVKAPGEMGADIAVGEGRWIGNSLNFGGPYVGLFTARSIFSARCRAPLRRDGRRGWAPQLRPDPLDARTAYQTRQGDVQHLHQLGAMRARLQHPSDAARRSRLAALARINHANAVDLAGKLARVGGVEVLNASFFNEFTIRIPGDAADAIERLAARGVLGGVPASRLAPGRGLRLPNPAES